ITIRDAFGNRVTNSSAAVTMTVSSGGTTVGTTTVNAVNGIATFTNVGISGTAGTQYTLSFASNTLTSTNQTIRINSQTKMLVVGSGPMTSSNPFSTINLYNTNSNQPTTSMVPFPGFTGPIRVSSGDFDRDGRNEIVAAAGPGGGPAITIIDSQTGLPKAAFFAYSPAFRGGLYMAVKDFNGDGTADIITGTGFGGGPHVKVFDGRNFQEMASFFAFSPFFTGGVTVAAEDLNGDNKTEIVTGAGPGGGPQVKVFDGATLRMRTSWFAYPPNFSGGVFVSVGDIGSDGSFEVVTGTGQGGGPVVGVWNALTGNQLALFFAYSPNFTGGVRVAVSDANGDGISDLVTGAGPGGGPQINVYDFPNLNLLQVFFSGLPSNRQGVFVG
ncbi:MAG: FG-GAP-like repeat-containing protein, partial [Gemmataceae bacterium]